MTTTAISAVVPRSRTKVAGRIISVRAYVTPWVRIDAELSDGTGILVVRFMGRAEITGLEPGRTLLVEGTAGIEDENLVMRNPLYDFGPDDPSSGAASMTSW